MQTKRRALLTGLTAGLALAALAGPAAAQYDYPSAPITVIVPYGAGGADRQIRALAPSLSERLGQPVVVENRPGGGAVIGTTEVARAEPDGYTLLFTGTSALDVVPNLRQTPYSIDDFKTIGTLTATGLIIAARADAPYATLDELLEYAKANPGAVNMGSAGTGTSTHIVGEAFQYAAGIDFTHIPYEGVAQAVQGMLGGHVDLVVGLPGVMLPHIEAGKLNGLAATGEERSPYLPDTPTLVERGIDLVEETKFGLLAPAETPQPIIDKLEAVLKAAVEDPTFVQGMDKSFTTAAFFSGQEFEDALRKNDAAYKRLFSETDILKSINQ